MASSLNAVAVFAAEMAADVLMVHDTATVRSGNPTITMGLRGMAHLSFELLGPDHDLHSGMHGGLAPNPAQGIAAMIAGLFNADGSVAVAGFYDDVRPLEPWERDMWAKVPGVSDADILDITGSPSTFGEPGYSSAERLWARPTAEVNGIGGGYQGEGSKTVIPAEAMAKFSFRLVPDQDPVDIAKKVKSHLKKHCPPGINIEIEVGHDGKPFIADPHSENGRAGQAALKKARVFALEVA